VGWDYIISGRILSVELLCFITPKYQYDQSISHQSPPKTANSKQPTKNKYLQQSTAIKQQSNSNQTAIKQQSP
jgi:hypothetical protein